MTLRTSLLPFRAALFASLGLPVAGALFACSSSSDTQATGPAGAGGGGSPGADSGTGGSSGQAGSSSGGASGGGGMAGGGGAAGGGGGAGGGDGAAGSASICKNPVPQIGLDGKPTGFVACDGGFSHRVEKKTCPSSLPRGTACGTGTPVDDAGLHDGLCATDADCTAAPHGHCESGALAGCSCVYGCVTDDECGVGSICGCGDPVGTCIAAACTVDADCGADFICMTASDGCGAIFGCQSAADTCVTASDCTSDAGPMQCGWVTDHHECTFTHPCGTGRPFLVDGRALVAELAETAAWSAELSPDLTALGPDTRGALARHWTEVALMEHASIAAFARFSLDLLAFAAPPELLSAAQVAMVDETAHARDAFALASAYAGRDVGPGVLVLGGALSGASRLDVVRTAIIEGCIGETVAAVEAAEALTSATDPAVRAVLARVAADEARHAELAWRFLRLVLGGPDRQLAGDAERALLELVSGGVDDPTPSSGEGAALAAHGVLPLATRREIRRRVLTDVVRPCARALVDGNTSAPSASQINAPRTLPGHTQ